MLTSNFSFLNPGSCCLHFLRGLPLSRMIFSFVPVTLDASFVVLTCRCMRSSFFAKPEPYFEFHQRHHSPFTLSIDNRYQGVLQVVSKLSYSYPKSPTFSRFIHPNLLSMSTSTRSSFRLPSFDNHFAFRTQTATRTLLSQ